MEGGKFFFNTVREGDSVLFATEDENDAHNWVMAFYRATGQAHKPTPPVSTGKNSSVLTANQGADNDRARKHGMEEFIAKDPVGAGHHDMFSDLQKWSLDWRLKDPFASLVRLQKNTFPGNTSKASLLDTVVLKKLGSIYSKSTKIQFSPSILELDH